MTKKILIADSDPLFIENLSNQIKGKKECEIITAFDGANALNKARKESPDLIIAEETLSILDGFKLCRLLKFDKQRRNIPIIILSSNPDEANKALAKELGADDYKLRSPDSTLLESVESLIVRERMK